MLEEVEAVRRKDYFGSCKVPPWSKTTELFAFVSSLMHASGNGEDDARDGVRSDQN